MSHKKKAYQNMLANGMPKRTRYSADTVQLGGDAECHYYWDNGVLYFSERGSSYAVTKCNSPIKAENYVKRKNKKR
ncbi:MAG: hypothetical protein J6U16_08995 [Ruminococcus sp.]|nr:hypothetical protein [Ruminococcus sp.]